jgi:hypothetical protein
MLGNQNTVLWLTPHTAVTPKDGHAIFWYDVRFSFSYYYRFSFIVDGQHISAMARSSQALSEIVDVVRRLLLTNAREVRELELTNVDHSSDVFFNAPSFAYLVEQCQSLKYLTLSGIDLDEDHIRVLGAYSRPDIKIKLISCTFIRAATSALVQLLGRNQGPTNLFFCNIDSLVVTDGLRGNSRLKNFTPCLSFNHREDVNRVVLTLAGALRENKGLVHLDLTSYWSMSENTWDVLCDSLKTHPTLQVLILLSNNSYARPRRGLRTGWDFVPLPAPAHLKVRIQSLVDMMKVNTLIHTIHLGGYDTEHELYRGSIVPYLKTNRFRPCARAIQKARPIAYRAKVLGRALLAARTDPNRLWMLLSGNAEITFPSTAATTNTPATTTAAAPSNAAAVAATTGAAAAVTRDASTIYQFL